MVWVTPYRPRGGTTRRPALGAVRAAVEVPGEEAVANVGGQQTVSWPWRAQGMGRRPPAVGLPPSRRAPGHPPHAPDVGSATRLARRTGTPRPRRRHSAGYGR